MVPNRWASQTVSIYVGVSVFVCLCVCLNVFYCPTVPIRIETDGEAVPCTSGLLPNTRTQPTCSIQYALIEHFLFFHRENFPCVLSIVCPLLLPLHIVATVSHTSVCKE